MPVRDEVRPRSDGGYEGEGYLFGRKFCSFRFKPLPRSQLTKRQLLFPLPRERFV